MEFTYLTNIFSVILFFFILNSNKYTYNIELINGFVLLHNLIEQMNDVIYPKCLYNLDEEVSGNEEVENTNLQCKKDVKYEDKYLEVIKKLSNEFVLTEDEKILEKQKYEEHYDSLIENYKKLITLYLEQIKQLELKRYELISMTDEEYIKDCKNNDVNDDYDSDFDNLNKETKITEITEEINNQKELLNNIEIKITNTSDLVELSKEYAKTYVIQKRKEKLEGCHVMEYTPLGNVLMTYNVNRETFSYYSDSTIPYRYLEVVGRKFVKFFNCRPIFVDMQEELKICEEKNENDRLKKEKDELLKQEQFDNKNTIIEPKKNVFAKFKSYNKDAATGRVNKVPAPKNNISNNQSVNSSEGNKILLKNNANRYTYEGKISNYIFIKKIEKKVTNKKYGITFADFKKMNINNKK